MRGYIAERQIVVEIRDLEKLGAVVEGAVEAGVKLDSPKNPSLDLQRVEVLMDGSTVVSSLLMDDHALPLD